MKFRLTSEIVLQDFYDPGAKYFMLKPNYYKFPSGKPLKSLELNFRPNVDF